jgi:hypothetical protein
MFTSLRKTSALLSLVSLIALGGCAAAGPAGSLNNPDARPVAAAGFKLDGFKVVWQDNPAFRTSFNYLAPKGSTGTPPPEALRNSTNERVSTILKFYRDEAVPTLTAALIEQRAAAGNVHRIVLTPTSAFQDISGWGTKVTVRATIFNADNKAVWFTDIESSSGWQLLGPNVSRPDGSYMKNFVEGLVATMRKAGLVGQA